MPETTQVNLWDLDLTDEVGDTIEEYPGGTKEQPEYAVVQAPVHGGELNKVTFPVWLKKARSDADQVAAAGMWAIVVELPSCVVVYDTHAED